MHSYFKILRLGLLIPKNQLCGSILQYSKLWEPDYLIYAKTKTPEYDVINFQIRGFDFAVLEKYQSCVHKTAKVMGIDVYNCYAAPHQQLEVHLLKPNSSTINKKYEMKVYERIVQVINVKSHIMPLFIEAVMTTCPPGVKLNVHKHTSEIEENLYVPNYEVIELKKKIEDMQRVKKKK